MLDTPTDITHILYEGELSFDDAQLESLAAASPTREALKGLGRPIVSIGYPQWWNLVELFREQGQVLPAELALLLHEADFFLVRLACSFRPHRTGRIEWARFNVYMRPKDVHQPVPITLDIYPREVYNEILRDIKVVIAPSLKFNELLEANLGEFGVGFRYEKLEPVIVGSGALQSDPSWDFYKTSKSDVRGAKFLYLIVKRPRGVRAVRVSFEIEADVRTKSGVLRATIQSVQAHLGALICQDDQ